MATTAEIQAKIAAIETKLAAGVRSVAHGDRATSYDLQVLSDERDRLQRQLALQVSQYQRVVFKNA